MLTPVTDEEVLSRLWTIKERAIAENDTDEMRRLVLIYRGLGYECNAAALERRLAA